MKKNLRAAAVQFEHSPGDKEANFKKIDSFLEIAARERSELVIFPECCITGYWFLRHLSKSELLKLAEPVFEGPSSQGLISRAREYNMTIGAGFVEIAKDGELFNTYVVALPDGKTYFHRKIHCFISQHLESGSEYCVFETPYGVKMGVLICYDNNIGENVRMTALHGANILLAQHQTGGCRSKDPNIMGHIDRAVWDDRGKNPQVIEKEFRGPKGREWLLRWLPARAHDNGMFLLFSNGVGVDDDEIRTGNAMIIDPYGRIISETWKAGDDIVISDLDFGLLDENTGQRWIRTRRPGLYGPLSVPTGNEEDTRTVRFDKKGI